MLAFWTWLLPWTAPWQTWRPPWTCPTCLYLGGTAWWKGTPLPWPSNLRMTCTLQRRLPWQFSSSMKTLTTSPFSTMTVSVRKEKNHKVDLVKTQLDNSWFHCVLRFLLWKKNCIVLERPRDFRWLIHSVFLHLNLENVKVKVLFAFFSQTWISSPVEI